MKNRDLKIINGILKALDEEIDCHVGIFLRERAFLENPLEAKEIVLLNLEREESEIKLKRFKQHVMGLTGGTEALVNQEISNPELMDQTAIFDKV